jgi:biotin transport system substrate-specific component
MKYSIRSIAEIAVFASLLAVAAPFSIPIGPIPISLGTLFVYLAAATLGAKRGVAAVAVYLLLGAIGLPVFSNWGAGFVKIAGPTGGYLLGYLPLALITGLAADAKPAFLKYAKYPAGMILGTIVLYALGTAWFMLGSGYGFAEALTLCVLPFLVGDSIKIVAASALAPLLRVRVLTRRI